MSSSNSFNICPRCGNSNTLNAKFCARCGGELKLPEEPIVCHNCRTRNTPMANFCRNCGAELRVGYATKICARCGNEVPAEQNVCTCGYMFAQNAYATPIPVRGDGTVDNVLTATGADGNQAAGEQKGKRGKREKKAKDNRVYSHKGGRAFAIVALVLLLVFAYFVIVPSCVVRPLVVSNFDQGLFTDPSMTIDATSVRHYGYDVVMTVVNAFLGEGTFGDYIAAHGGTVVAVVAALVAIFAVAAVVHLIVCIVRIIKPKRSRKPNWCFFALAVLTTVVVALVAVFNFVAVGEGFFATVAGIFKLAEGWSLGYVLYAIPAYFWFFFLYSLVAKARALKEQTVAQVTEEQAA